jgi:hypothetical protein
MQSVRVCVLLASFLEAGMSMRSGEARAKWWGVPNLVMNTVTYMMFKQIA